MTVTPFRFPGQDATTATAPSTGYGLDVDTVTGLPFVINAAGVKQFTITSTEQIQDVVGSLLAGAGAASVSYDDTSNTLTISVSTEAVQDAAFSALGSTSTLALTYNDAANTVTGAVLDSPTVAGQTPANLRDRSTHTGQQASTTIGDFVEAVQDIVGAFFLDSAQVDVTYDDVANAISALLAAGSVANTTLANVPTATVKGRIAAGTGNVSDLTTTQLTTLVDTATTTLKGAQSPADKARQDNAAKYAVNLLDFGADPTGAASAITALTNAIAALPAGGIVLLPPGTYDLTTAAPYTVSANNIILRGAGPNVTTIRSTSATGDILRLTGYGCAVEDLSIQGPGTSTTSNRTSGIGLDIQSTSGWASNINLAYHWDALRIGGHLVDVEGIDCRYFKNNGIVVDHQSDHRVVRVLMNNAAATLPAGAGIDVRITASLVLEQLNIINSNWALNLSPTSGVTIPSVKATDCFFDTSAIGLRCAGAGFVYRSEFTNCWFSSMSTAGILLAPTTAGGVDGLTFVNCDIYNNVAGTTNGVSANGNVGKWKMVGCSVAGWTNGLNLSPGPAHFPTIANNTVGAVSAFGVNTVGILVAAGAYKGLVIAENDVIDNTTNLTLGALTVTVGTAGSHRIIDNAGINPRTGVELRPVATPALATLYTNLTGYRVQILVKHGATANTGIILNGVTITAAFVAAQVVTYILEPGGSIQFTGGTAPTVWSWVGQ